MINYVTASDIGRQFNLKATTIKRWARRGLIPSIRLTGRVLRFDPAAVEQALRERGARQQVGEGAHA